MLNFIAMPKKLYRAKFAYTLDLLIFYNMKREIFSASKCGGINSMFNHFHHHHHHHNHNVLHEHENNFIICQILPTKAADVYSVVADSSTKSIIPTNSLFVTDLFEQLNQNKREIRNKIKLPRYNHYYDKYFIQKSHCYKNFRGKQSIGSNYLKVDQESCSLLNKCKRDISIINNNRNLTTSIKIQRTMSTAATKSTKSPQSSILQNGILNGTNDLSKIDTVISESESSVAETPGSLNGASNTTETTDQNGKPSCFNSSLSDIIQFLELVGGLKHTKRTGWVLRDVKDCESISGHMYRMSMMTFLLNGSEGLDQIRCMELALVHDLAESIVGDLTPFCGVSKEDKKQREMDAMENICKMIRPRGERMWKLFQEYEAAETPESKFVKDLDRLDMVLQAFEYEKRDNCIMKHQEFFDSTEGKFEHPFVKKLVEEIYKQRRQLTNENCIIQQQEQQERNQNDHTDENCHRKNGHAETCNETTIIECSDSDLSKKKVTTTS